MTSSDFVDPNFQQPRSACGTFAKGCSVVIALIIAASAMGFWYLYSHRKEYLARASEWEQHEKQEGAKFGHQASESQCVEHVAFQHRIERSLTDTLRQRWWVAACLKESVAQKEFCSGVPDPKDLGRSQAWQKVQCAEAKLNDASCGNIFDEMQRYCYDKERAKKVP